MRALRRGPRNYVQVVVRQLTVDVNDVPSAKLLPNNAASERHKRALRSAWRKRVAKLIRKKYNSVGDGGPKTADGLANPYLLCPHYAERVLAYDLVVTIYWPKGRRRPDNDGALSACKGLLDGAADVLGVDDRLCESLTIMQRRGDEYGEPGGLVRLAYTFLAPPNGHDFCRGACLNSAHLDTA